MVGEFFNMTDNDNNPDINLISIKQPQFNEAAVSGWFYIIEAQFHIKNITLTATKYFNTLAALPPHVVANIPREVLESQDYDSLKSNLVGSFEQTKPEIFERLSQQTKMTGQPSLYLRVLQSLAAKAGIGDCEQLIRHKFLAALPNTISPAVAAQQTWTLTQLGTLADELMPMHNNICNLTQRPEATPQKQQVSSNFNPKKSFSSIPVGLEPFSENQRPKICRSHIYFADLARTCKPWCKYPNKKNCRVEPSSRPASPQRSSEN